MTISYLIPSFVQSTIIARFAQYTVGTVMGLTMLVWITGRAGSPVQVVIHVTEANVEVAVGGHTFRIGEQSYDPIVLPLTPGPYELVMTRAGQVLYRKSFVVQSGKACVLTAYDPNRLSSSSSLP